MSYSSLKFLIII